MTNWSATAGQHARHGTAAHPLKAWRRAVDGAVEIASETNGTEVIALAVDGDTARLFPALDEAGELDGPATREAGLLLVSLVEGELGTPGSTSE